MATLGIGGVDPGLHGAMAFATFEAEEDVILSITLRDIALLPIMADNQESTFYGWVEAKAVADWFEQHTMRFNAAMHRVFVEEQAVRASWQIKDVNQERVLNQQVGQVVGSLESRGYLVHPVWSTAWHPATGTQGKSQLTPAGYRAQCVRRARTLFGCTPELFLANSGRSYDANKIDAALIAWAGLRILGGWRFREGGMSGGHTNGSGVHA